ncbi:HipA N-terminal domain-containing protein [Desulfamplus magnetovallimortis]|uniref:HipA N-terminal domain-containing protein n=1 Tax=Desulfamplus magnetovallimortis TaxID=1246637 RepID=UPI00164679AF
METLNVYYDQLLVGTLTLDAHRLFSFKYSRQWMTSQVAFPLSVCLPMQDEPFSDHPTRALGEPAGGVD